jgi:glycosyltransferase involved in cell wall biosynthesis
MGEYFFQKKNEKTIIPLPICPGKVFTSMDIGIHQSEEIILFYHGIINPMRKIENLIILTSLIIRDLPTKNIKLVMIGKCYSENYKRKLQGIINERNLNNIVLIKDEIPIEEIPDEIGKASVGLSLIPPSEAYNISSPTKVVEYLALGLPVIGNSEIFDQDYVIKESNGGISTPYEINSMKESLIKLILNEELRIKMGRSGRAWIIKYRTYEILATKLYNDYHNYLHENEIR